MARVLKGSHSKRAFHPSCPGGAWHTLSNRPIQSLDDKSVKYTQTEIHITPSNK